MDSLQVKDGKTEPVEVEWNSDFICPGATHLFPLYLRVSDPCLVGQSDVRQSPHMVWYVPEIKRGCPEMRQNPKDLTTTSSLVGLSSLKRCLLFSKCKLRHYCVPARHCSRPHSAAMNKLDGVAAPLPLNSRGGGEANKEISGLISYLIIVQEGDEKVTVCLNSPHSQRLKGLMPPPHLSLIPQGGSRSKVGRCDSRLHPQYMFHEDHS